MKTQLLGSAFILIYILISQFSSGYEFEKTYFPFAKMDMYLGEKREAQVHALYIENNGEFCRYPKCPGLKSSLHPRDFFFKFRHLSNQLEQEPEDGLLETFWKLFDQNSYQGHGFRLVVETIDPAEFLKTGEIRDSILVLEGVIPE